MCFFPLEHLIYTTMLSLVHEGTIKAVQLEITQATSVQQNKAKIQHLLDVSLLNKMCMNKYHVK